MLSSPLCHLTRVTQRPSSSNSWLALVATPRSALSSTLTDFVANLGDGPHHLRHPVLAQRSSLWINNVER